MKKLASTISAALLVAVLAVGLAATGAAEDEESSEVTVEVSGVTELDVRPSALEYQDVEPGEDREISENDFEHLEISNIGSENIQEIHAESTMPAVNPFGDSDAEHDTGNFITISTETANDGDYSDLETGLADESTMHFLNRVEYSETTPPTYITTEDGDIEDSEAGSTVIDGGDVEEEVGRFRAGGVEYFYVLYHEGGTASEDNFVLRIGDAPHTSTELGTVDFSNDGDDSYTEYTQDDAESADGFSDQYSLLTGQEFVSFDTGDSDFEGENLVEDGAVNEEELPESLEDVQVRQYNLYPYTEDTEGEENHIIRTKFNTEQQSPVGEDRSDKTNSGSQKAIFSASEPNNQLQPGASFPIDVGIQISQGVDQDGVSSGSMTLIASEQELEE